jgi:hypothetical protein
LKAGKTGKEERKNKGIEEHLGRYESRTERKNAGEKD